MSADDARTVTGPVRLRMALARGRPWLVAGFWVLVAAGVGGALYQAGSQTSYGAVVAALGAVPPSRVALALAATAASYLALTGYDVCALRYAGATLPYRVVAATSFIAYALSNSIGLGVLTGGGVRMRLYGAAGVDPGRISLAIAFAAMAFGMGTVAVGTLGLVWSAPAAAPLLGISAATLRWVAAAVAAGGALALLALHRRRGRSVLGVRVPSAALTVRVLLFAMVDMTASATVLWLLLPAGAVGFPLLVSCYAVAVLAGVLSHVPGGLGVLEAVMLTALGGAVPTHDVVAALVLNRVVYYLVPLLLGLLMLAAQELRRSSAAPVVRAAVSLAPRLLAAVTLAAGVMLLVRGVLPASRTAPLPLALVEVTHFVGSIAGLGLLFVARGLLWRLDAAWWAGLALTVIAAIVAATRGPSPWEVAYLGVLVLSLLATRRQFSRRSALLAVPFDGGWLLAVLAIITALTGLLLFAYRDVAYGGELWWQFELDDHAPRAMRALVGVALVTFAVTLWQLLRPRRAPLPLPEAGALARAGDIVRRQDSADAGLALMGDKRLLFSDAGTAFVMFGRHHRTWVALFDPVGPQDEWRPLIWRFLELAREWRGRPCFYQVGPAALPLYLDAGLRLFKLGEYAYVPLGDFCLRGKSRASLRHSVGRARREGLTLEIVPAACVSSLMGEIGAISTSWLNHRHGREKGFSLGTFSDAYLQRQPLALVRHQGVPVAFATLMLTDTRLEASIDLMRHVPSAPNGTMDFLLVELMLHFQAQGFQRFALGMAPLSGLVDHPLASEWHQLGRLLFAYGERFYNFRGVRAFKDKFGPVWEPRYLAAPGGVAPLLALADIAALVARGNRPSRPR